MADLENVNWEGTYGGGFVTKMEKVDPVMSGVLRRWVVVLCRWVVVLRRWVVVLRHWVVL